MAPSILTETGPKEVKVRPTYEQRHVTEEPLPNDGKVRLHEIFTSVQGEGPDIGEIATFVRLGLCNRRCVWCDTDYSIKQTVPEAELAEFLYEKYGHGSLPGKRFVIWTGGEPTLQAEALTRIMDSLTTVPGAPWYFTCESNGVLVERFETWEFYGRLGRVVLSPKPPSSKNPPYDWDALWGQLYQQGGRHLVHRRMVVKPVIMDEEDMAWFRAAAEHPSRPLEVPFAMQTYVDPDDPSGMADFRGFWQRTLTQDFMEWMRQYNVRLLPRLHNLIWGNLQGV